MVAVVEEVVGVVVAAVHSEVEEAHQGVAVDLLGVEVVVLEGEADSRSSLSLMFIETSILHSLYPVGNFHVLAT